MCTYGVLVCLGVQYVCWQCSLRLFLHPLLISCLFMVYLTIIVVCHAKNRKWRDWCKSNVSLSISHFFWLLLRVFMFMHELEWCHSNNIFKAYEPCLSVTFMCVFAMLMCIYMSVSVGKLKYILLFYFALLYASNGKDHQSHFKRLRWRKRDQL